MKERVIYLKDLFYYICRKWRIALILMLVFALVLNFYGWYRAKKAADASASSHRDELEALRENLTEKQIFDAEDRARNYFVYYRQYLDQGQYMENSVYFKLDPTAVPVFRAEYLAENWAGYRGVHRNPGANRLPMYLSRFVLLRKVMRCWTGSRKCLTCKTANNMCENFIIQRPLDRE
ncbi:MAG: hypothetical protein IJL43_02710 [Lachnospiraceae bacterium]|nr:hypothetical protein [Lachnospiraceae bacterium]